MQHQIKRLLHSCVLLIALCWLVAVTGCNSPRLNRVVVGEKVVNAGEKTGVTVVREKKKMLVQPGMFLKTNDEVTTGGKSTAQLTFPGGTEVVLFPNTKVRIGSLWVVFGELLANVKGYFSIESENGEAVVGGTEFFVRRRGNDEMEISVVDGSVSLKSKRNGHKVVVNKSEMGVLARDRAAPGRSKPRKFTLNRKSAKALKSKRDFVEKYVRTRPQIVVPQPPDRRDPAWPRPWGRRPPAEVERDGPGNGAIRDPKIPYLRPRRPHAKWDLKPTTGSEDVNEIIPR